MHWRLVISYAVLIVTVAVGPFFLFSNREPKRITLDAGAIEPPVPNRVQAVDAGPRRRHHFRDSVEAGVAAPKAHPPDLRVVHCQETTVDRETLRECLEAIR